MVHLYLHVIYNDLYNFVTLHLLYRTSTNLPSRWLWLPVSNIPLWQIVCFCGIVIGTPCCTDTFADRGPIVRGSHEAPVITNRIPAGYRSLKRPVLRSKGCRLLLKTVRHSLNATEITIISMSILAIAVFPQWSSRRFTTSIKFKLNKFHLTFDAVTEKSKNLQNHSLLWKCRINIAS